MEKLRKILVIILIMILGMILSVKSDAASFTASVSKSTVTPGETVTITLNASGLTGRFDITGTNCTVSPSKIWVEKGVPESKITVTTKSSGTAKVTITAQSVADSNRNDVTGSTGVNITVKEPESTNTGNNSGGTTNGGNNSSSNSGNTSNNNGTTSSGSNTGSTGNSGTNNGGATSTSSSTAELKMIVTSPVDFRGFKSASTGPYKITVENNVTSISVSTTKKDNGQKVSISGNKNLDVGTNKVTVEVTSADGKNTKSYIIYVTRKTGEDEEEKIPNQVEEEDDEVKEKLGLSAIILEQGYTLTPEFKSDIYEYTIDLTEELAEFPITAIATQNDAKIEITGNEELVEGENIIIIKVTSADGKETVEYKIKLNKILEQVVVPPVVTKTRATPLDLNSFNKINNYSIAIITMIVIITLIGIIAVILDYTKTRVALIEGDVDEGAVNTAKDYFNYGSTFIEEEPKRRGRNKGKHA